VLTFVRNKQQPRQLRKYRLAIEPIAHCYAARIALAAAPYHASGLDPLAQWRRGITQNGASLAAARPVLGITELPTELKLIGPY
jgi:hypothetical protein